MLYLGSSNRLLSEEVMSEGTISSTALWPREIICRALDLGATALILIHNHPSGDPAPSPADVSGTQRVIDAGRELDIVVHDHIIVARHGHTSMRGQNLI